MEVSATLDMPDETLQSHYRTTTMNPFLTRNIQIYGAKRGKWVTRMLSSIGVCSKQDFVETNYRDAAQLASDVEQGVVLSRNQAGQVIDLFRKPVCNLGNHIYAALNKDNINNTSTILFYFVNYGGAQRLVNCAGEFIYDDSVCKNGIIGIYPQHSIYHHSRPQNVQVHRKHYLHSVVLGPIESIGDPKKMKPNGPLLVLKSNDNVFQGMFSDARLKTRIELIRENYIRQGIHLYRFYWNETAKHLFGLQGKEYGLLTREIKMYYSHNVHSWTPDANHHTDHSHAYEYISISAKEAQENQELRKIAYLMLNKTLFNRSVEYLLHYRKSNPQKSLKNNSHNNSIQDSGLWNRLCRVVGWNPTVPTSNAERRIQEETTNII